MTYSAEISRSNPSAIIILLDRSRSMSDPFPNEGSPKSVAAAQVVNRFLAELTMKCAKGAEIYDYYHVAAIGYGREVTNALGSRGHEIELAPISELGDNPLRLDSVTKKVPDGAGGLVETTTQMPIWVEAVADGNTPMCRALDCAQALLTPWVAEHQDCYPPTVLNITDGEANDGDPREPARRLRQLSTQDGDTLLFNCHLSSQRAMPTLFPNTTEGLNDQLADALFEMSSDLPETQLEAAVAEGFPVLKGSRGFVYNGGVEDLIRFIDIGSRATMR